MFSSVDDVIKMATVTCTEPCFIYTNVLIVFHVDCPNDCLMILNFKKERKNTAKYIYQWRIEPFISLNDIFFPKNNCNS